MDCNFWSTVASTVVGGVITFVAAQVYFWKSKPVERLLGSLVDNLRAVLVEPELKEFLDSSAERIFEGKQPKNAEVPYLDLAVLNFKKILPESEVKLLLKVVDTGLDFRNPEGATLTDETGRRLELKRVGFGYMVSTFTAPRVDGEKKLTLVLTDEKQNQSPSFELKYSVFKLEGSAA